MMMMVVNLINDWFWWFEPVHCLPPAHCFPRLKSERFFVGSHLSEPTISLQDQSNPERIRGSAAFTK
jgi:hypothetical protein